MMLIQGTATIRKFGGIDNKTALTDVSQEFFTDALNLDFSTPFRVDKRNGYSKFNSVAITGTPSVNTLFRYVGSADTSMFAWCNDGTIRKDQAAAGSFANSRSGLTTQSSVYASTVQFGGRRVSTTNYAGRLFYVNGIDSNLTYSEADGWETMGVSAPSTVPTVALSGYTFGSAAMASGDFYFKVTQYNSRKGLESNPTQPSTVFSLSASGGAVTVTLPATGDSQCDYKRIYRTPSTAVGTYYYLAQVASSATTYLASASDAALGAAVETDNNPPPKMKYIEEYQACLFGAGDTTDSVSKSLLYYSKQLDNSPESWPLSYYLSITPDDGDEITLVKKIADRLMVAKKHSWGVVIGDSPSNFRYVQLDASHGCIAPNSAALAENVVIFLSNDGWRMCNGATSEKLCKNTMEIDNLSLNYEQLNKIYGRYYQKKRQYVCGIVTGSNTEIDKTIRIQFPDHQWCYDDETFVCLEQFFDTNNTEAFYAGAAAGQAYTMFPAGVYTDNGANVSWNFETGPIFMESPDRFKKFHTLVLNVDDGSTPVINFQYSVDGGTRSSPKSLTCSTKYKMTGMNKTGRFAQLYMSGVSNNHVRLNDMEVRASVEPRSRW